MTNKKQEQKDIEFAMNKLLETVIVGAMISKGNKPFSDDFVQIQLSVHVPLEILEAIKNLDGNQKSSLEDLDAVTSLLFSALIGIGFNTKLNEIVFKAEGK